MGLSTYRGIQIDTVASGDGGVALTNNFTELANRVGKTHDDTRDPTTTDDGTAGYSEWSKWRNTSTNNVFVCVDASTGAAVWKPLVSGTVGTSANNLVQLTSAGKLPAVDGSLLTGITSGGTGDVTGASSSVDSDVALFNGTTGKTIKDSGVKIGTSANNLVQLDGSGKLPAVDGSQLTGITTGSPSSITFAALTADPSTPSNGETTAPAMSM